MSAEASKPVVVPEAAPVAPVEVAPVAVEEVAAEKPIVPAEEALKVEETPKVEGDAAVVAPVEEEKKEEEKAAEKVEEKVAEPIYSGALGYKAPGLKK